MLPWLSTSRACFTCSTSFAISSFFTSLSCSFLLSFDSFSCCSRRCCRSALACASLCCRSAADSAIHSRMALLAREEMSVDGRRERERSGRGEREETEDATGDDREREDTHELGEAGWRGTTGAHEGCGADGVGTSPGATAANGAVTCACAAVGRTGMVSDVLPLACSSPSCGRAVEASSTGAFDSTGAGCSCRSSDALPAAAFRWTGGSVVIGIHVTTVTDSSEDVSVVDVPADWCECDGESGVPVVGIAPVCACRRLACECSSGRRRDTRDMSSPAPSARELVAVVSIVIADSDSCVRAWQLADGDLSAALAWDAAVRRARGA